MSWISPLPRGSTQCPQVESLTGNQLAEKNPIRGTLKAMVSEKSVAEVKRLVRCQSECPHSGNKWHCPTPHAWLWPLTMGEPVNT